MSNNPFADQQDASGERLNPYVSPAPIAGPTLAPFGKEQAAASLKTPAIVLLVMTILTVIYRLIDLPFGLYMMSQAGAQQPAGYLVGSIMGASVAILLNIATISGCVSMLKLSNYSSARTAAIISVIPLCAPCMIFGIPFGVWALIVLNKLEVKQAFAA